MKIVCNGIVDFTRKTWINRSMDSNREATKKFWSLPQKGREEKNRECEFIDDIIQKSHLEKLLLDNLQNIDTVFDGGAGSGRFSLLLAKLGKKVVHYDLSESMISVAKEQAANLGVSKNIDFINGDLNDLSGFHDSSFDLVVSFDAPVSYCYPNHINVINDLIRITKRKIILSVSSKYGSVGYCLNPFQKYQYYLAEFDRKEMENSLNLISDMEIEKSIADAELVFNRSRFGSIESIEKALQRNETPWPVTYLFSLEELQGLFLENGLRNITFAGPGAFSRSIPNQILKKIMNNEEIKRRFLELCYKIDGKQSVSGLGKDNIVIKGEK